jgi:hypothetical protein
VPSVQEMAGSLQWAPLLWSMHDSPEGAPSRPPPAIAADVVLLRGCGNTTLASRDGRELLCLRKKGSHWSRLRCRRHHSVPGTGLIGMLMSPALSLQPEDMCIFGGVGCLPFYKAHASSTVRFRGVKVESYAPSRSAHTPVRR